MYWKQSSFSATQFSAPAATTAWTPPAKRCAKDNPKHPLLPTRYIRCHSQDSISQCFLRQPRGRSFSPIRCVAMIRTANSRWIIVSAVSLTDSAADISKLGSVLCAQITTQTADITGAYWYYYLEMKNYCANGQCFADLPTRDQDKYCVW